ncbi:hypothetical protein L596_011102 [Steinernema carpocapsae]|uniref:Uncharacterized protein n=1 Tax=Steinernema carpocapsae TaxID=34508 RepID=A0A4U5NTQ2_STECR|nr:hypothetical protein L596_011102 [Steinernema carpocapsae]
MNSYDELSLLRIGAKPNAIQIKSNLHHPEPLSLFFSATNSSLPAASLTDSLHRKLFSILRIPFNHSRICPPLRSPESESQHLFLPLLLVGIHHNFSRVCSMHTSST